MGHTCNQSFRRLRKENNELKPVLYSEPLPIRYTEGKEGRK